MKYLLVLLVIVVAFGIWRNKRRAEVAERKATAPMPTPTLQQPQNMVECAHCGLHLPQADAVTHTTTGRNSLHYCSAEHRRLGPQNTGDH